MNSIEHSRTQVATLLALLALTLLACGSVEPSDRNCGDASTCKKADGGRDADLNTGFICHLNNECPTGRGICADGGVCVGCTGDDDCTTPTSPICDTTTNTCVPCTTDAQCVAKLGATENPGVCMFHQDGHCATAAEAVYVQNITTGAGCLGTATPGGGTSVMPFCALAPAIVSADKRTLFVLRGGSIGGGTTISGAPTPLSIVGQMSATITAGAAQAGLHLTGSDVYVRDVRIEGSDPTATIGIIADGSATIRLDGLDVEEMPQGGFRVTSSSYDVINSIFAGNGGTRDDGNRYIGGAWLLDTAPDAGVSGRFAFNTVVNNLRDGVVCANSTQTLEGSLLAGNFNGAADNTDCTLATTSKALGTGNPMLTSIYREAGPTSPCVDFVTTPPAGAPNHDIDLVPRPQGAAFDCGASEYKAP